MDIIQIVVYILAVVYIFSSTEINKQKATFLIMCSLLLFCSFFRTMAIGFDTRRYTEYFQMFRNMSLSECLKIEHESGYIVLTKAIGYLTDKSQVFLSIMSILTLVPIFCLIWKRSSNPILSLLIFVSVGNLFSSFAALRQWCAIAVFVLSYEFVVRRKPILFVASIIGAFYFHRSALFMIPLYFLYPIRMDRIKLVLAAILSFTIVIFAEPIMSFLNLFTRMEMEYSQNGGYILLLAYWAMVILIDVFAFPIENEKYLKMNYIALIYSAIIQPMCFTFSGFARIHLFTWFGMALSLPRFIQYMMRNYDLRNTFLMKVCVSILMIAWYVVTKEESVISLIFLEGN